MQLFFRSKQLQSRDPLHSFRQPGFIAYQSDPHIAFAISTEANTWSDDHMRLLQQQVRKAL
ncbi:hypothetical protein D3C75_1333160 [compost metagenome]